MNIKEKLEEWFKTIYERISLKPVKHVCRVCHNIFNEEEMSELDSSICEGCAKRE